MTLNCEEQDHDQNRRVRKAAHLYPSFSDFKFQFLKRRNASQLFTAAGLFYSLLDGC